MVDIGKTCANCVYAAAFKDDLTKRICQGLPPQIVPIPQPGSIQLTMHYPIVDSKGPICSLFKKKELDIMKIGV